MTHPCAGRQRGRPRGARPATARSEYSQLRRLGLIDDYLHHQVEQAQGRAIAMLDNHTGPFAAGWPAWAPDPSWPLPTLPDDADDPTTGR
ncbi:hypothetical protein ACIGXI_22765 [Kitasatospora aureofaciens]|uniref:hypothetical protein n=1 Tax=Kitasatospora aureofaciens TaxID=1894 RepID=UPI0037C7AAC4